MSEADHELMRRLGEGRTEALEELLRRWEGPVARVLGKLAGREVEDLSQEVFLRVVGARERYRPRGAFSTWLYRIVLNVARDAARRRRLRVWLSLENHEVVSNGSAPAEGAQRRELAEQVRRALEALPARLREPLVMKHFGELTFAEVAAVLGVPASTVKSRVQAGLERLRGELRRRGIDERELEP
jgi:RNA polymerase sigma-70 factor (ECF subfamily)